MVKGLSEHGGPNTLVLWTDTTREFSLWGVGGSSEEEECRDLEWDFSYNGKLLTPPTELVALLSTTTLSGRKSTPAPETYEVFTEVS